MTHVISVSATQPQDEFSHWSSYGPAVDVSAPGSSVLTTNCIASSCPHRDWGSHTYISGTSFATPNVAGVVALIRAKHPTWTPGQVVNRLYATVDDLGYAGWDNRYGRGRVNAYRALGASVVASPRPAGDGLETNNTLGAATYGRGMFRIAVASQGPANYQDLWWRSPGESESGWGVNLTQQGDVADHLDVLAREGALFTAAVEVTGEDPQQLKRRLRTGTVVTTDDRNWELRYTLSALRFNQSRAVAIDMESATVAAQGYRFRVPYGTLLCVSDKPLHGEIKLPGQANAFYERAISQHLMIGVETLRILRGEGAKLHSRKLRSFDEPPFR